MDCSTTGFPVLHHLLKLAPNSCPLSRWCHPTISSSVIPFSSCLQSFPASGSFLMSQLFASGSQSIRLQFQHELISFRIDWFDLLSLQGTLSSPRVWKHQFFSTQPSLWSTLTLTVNWITAYISGSFKGLFSLKSLHMKEDWEQNLSPCVFLTCILNRHVAEEICIIKPKLQFIN